MNPPRKILIIRPDRLGDLILSLPVARTLKKNFPSCEIVYLISPHNLDLADMVDYVDGWMPDSDNNNHRLPVRILARKIKSGKFDCLIELKPSWRTAVAGILSGVRMRIGTSRRLYSVFYNHKISIHRRSSGFHQTDLELRHLEPFGIKEYLTNPTLRVVDKGFNEARKLLDMVDRPYIVIHPGSGGSAPNWPMKHYRKLAVLIKEILDFEVVITDKNPPNPKFDNCVNLGGKTDLITLAGIISGARAFICGSTGPLHMADALGTRCLSFFANRSDIGPERWGPRRNLDFVLTSPDVCECHNLRNCYCIENVSPEDALAKLETLLNEDISAEVN